MQAVGDGPTCGRCALSLGDLSGNGGPLDIGSQPPEGSQDFQGLDPETEHFRIWGFQGGARNSGISIL